MTINELGLYVNRRLAWGHRTNDLWYIDRGGKYEIRTCGKYWTGDKWRIYTTGPDLILRTKRKKSK